MREYVCKSEKDLKIKIKDIVHDNYDKKVIKSNYKDSRKRENLSNFKKSLEEEYFYGR